MRQCAKSNIAHLKIVEVCSLFFKLFNNLTRAFFLCEDDCCGRVCGTAREAYGDQGAGPGCSVWALSCRRGPQKRNATTFRHTKL